jgi:hypothetical protein
MIIISMVDSRMVDFRIVALQDRGFRSGLFVERLRRRKFLAEPKHRVNAEQGHQQQPRADAGEEQPTQRFLRGDREQDHGDGRRQQDAERAAGGDDPCGKAAGIAALAHLGDAGRTDRRAGRGRGARHRREQRAGEYVGYAQATGHAMQPGMQRRIEILTGAGLADRRPLEDEQRDRQ